MEGTILAIFLVLQYVWLFTAINIINNKIDRIERKIKDKDERHK